MDLTFERGDPDRPRGHAVVYFRDAVDSSRVGSTYIIVLPVAVDIAKYVPPFLAGQVPDFGEAGLSAFAFPPAPERAESYDVVLGMAEARDDDLLFGGVFSLDDVSVLLTVIGEIVEEYAGRYEAATAVPAPIGEATEGVAGDSDGVDDVLYGMMSEADRVGELTKLAGRLRFASEGDDAATAAEAQAQITALAHHIPANRRIDRLLAAAKDRSSDGAQLAQLYLERAYCLLREDYLRVKALDEEITAIEAPG